MLDICQQVDNHYTGIDVDGYILEDEIGRGKNNIVYRANNKDLKSYAICNVIERDLLKADWELEFKRVEEKLIGIQQAMQYKGYPTFRINIPIHNIFCSLARVDLALSPESRSNLFAAESHVGPRLLLSMSLS
jgi:hypothetical protein